MNYLFKNWAAKKARLLVLLEEYAKASSYAIHR